MTSNYRNSAGTDLDNLFYVNNSNAGAIGFKCSDGKDLGNRYPSGSLGYNVGYKNSAGTDIGYLRTNTTPIVLIINSVTYTKSSNSTVTSGSHYVTVNFKISGGRPPYYIVMAVGETSHAFGVVGTYSKQSAGTKTLTSNRTYNFTYGNTYYCHLTAEDINDKVASEVKSFT